MVQEVQVIQVIQVVKMVKVFHVIYVFRKWKDLFGFNWGIYGNSKMSVLRNVLFSKKYTYSRNICINFRD